MYMRQEGRGRKKEVSERGIEMTRGIHVVLSPNYKS